MSYDYRNSHFVVTGKCKMLLTFLKQGIALGQVVISNTLSEIHSKHTGY